MSEDSYADYLVLCSAPSERQTQAIARHIIDEMRLAGQLLGQEGMDQVIGCFWITVVVAHIFFEGARSIDLDGFWDDVPESIDEEAS